MPVDRAIGVKARGKLADEFAQFIAADGVSATILVRERKQP
jgi:hypothetical protein